MKKKLLAIVTTTLLCISSLTGCQSMARNFGGDIELKLEPNRKLENITWKEDSLWYLTRPMEENEEAVTYKFEQSSEFGVFEGTVTVIESKQ